MIQWLIPILGFMWCCPAIGQHVQTNQALHTLTTIPTGLVAALPTCNAASNGMVRSVTNSLTPVVGLTVVTGGAVTVLVHCNGTNWIVA